MRAAFRRGATSPLAALLAFLVGMTFAVNRARIGAAVSGGGLLPAPNGGGTLLTSYLQEWHAVGGGTSSPGSALSGLFGLLGAPLGGADHAVAVLLLAAMPLAGLSAYCATRATALGRAGPRSPCGVGCVLGVAAGGGLGQLLRPARHLVHLHPAAHRAGRNRQRAARRPIGGGRSRPGHRSLAVAVHDHGDRAGLGCAELRRAGDVPAHRADCPGRLRVATTGAWYWGPPCRLLVLCRAAPGGPAAAMACGAAHPAGRAAARRWFDGRRSGVLADPAAHHWLRTAFCGRRLGAARGGGAGGDGPCPAHAVGCGGGRARCCCGHRTERSAPSPARRRDGGCGQRRSGTSTGGRWPVPGHHGRPAGACLQGRTANTFSAARRPRAGDGGVARCGRGVRWLSR